MAKKPARTWTLVVSLGLPLAVVGTSAMAISYATLIDVARVNGLPLPELFPILVDVGTVTTMIAAAQFRLRGVGGRWLAYATFIMLSGVSIMANSMHAWSAADLTVTSPWVAGLLAATPPAVLLAITHLVMKLVPDEKERAKLQAARDKAEAGAARQQVTAEPRPQKQHTSEMPRVDTSVAASLPPVNAEVAKTTATIPSGFSDEDVTQMVLQFVIDQGQRPTGALVGNWLGGKSAKTGQRFLAKLESQGLFEPTDEGELIPVEFSRAQG